MSTETKVPLAEIAAQNTKRVREEEQLRRTTYLLSYEKPASGLFKIICDSIMEQSLAKTRPAAEFDLFTPENCQKVEGITDLKYEERGDLVEMLEIMLRKECFRISSVGHGPTSSIITVEW